MNQSPAKISIIIPASNAEDTIERCIDSIYDNRHTPIECIVVVNNTSDNTMLICEKLKETYDGLIIIKSQMKGVSTARNIGLDHASGEIIGFCDADDYYEPNTIDAVIDKMNQYAAEIVITGLFRTETDGSRIVKEKPVVIFRDKIISVKKAQGYILNHPEIMGSVCNKFYRAEVMEHVKFDESLTHCEDMHFNMQILKKTQLRILLSDIIGYNYVYTASSATRDTDRCFTDDNKLKYVIAIQKIRNEFDQNVHIRREALHAIIVISVDNYSSDLSRARKKNLRTDMIHDFPYLFVGFYRYGLIRNMKRFVKCLFVLLNII